MTEEEKTYPSIPVKHWWLLRQRFKQSIPSVANAGYLATTLGMKEKSAKTNVIPSLIAFKIIDQDGKPTERARRWRDDKDYPALCEEIRQEIYPRELLGEAPPPSPESEPVVRWFTIKTGVGLVGARRMAGVYVLLCKADPSTGQDVAAPTRQKRPKQGSDQPADVTSVLPPQPVMPPKEQPASYPVPSIHFDIQIHISPEASTDQVDQIFASMAKHLLRLMNRDDEPTG